MPELPEVETIARMLRPILKGRTVTGVRNSWPRHIDRPVFSELVERVLGQTIHEVARRGKYLLFPLDLDTLIIHLRMSGHLTVEEVAKPIDKHTHTVFELDNGTELRFRDTRKFGRVYLVSDSSEILHKLGPEPLQTGFTPQILSEILRSHRRLLKPLLLDQTVLAGIGNIYADEALFYARLHPKRRSDSLNDQELRALHEGIQRVLRLGIKREGASISTYLKPTGEKGDMQNEVAVFRRTGDPCLVCSGPIQRMVLGGRSTHFCPTCQK